MFDKIYAMVTSAFGISTLPKDKEGKSVLTAKMEEEITEKWGSKFLESFKEDLKNAEQDGKSMTENENVPILQKELSELKEKFNTALSENNSLKTNMESLQEKIVKLSENPENDNPELIETNVNNQRTSFKADMSYRHNQIIDNYFNGDGTMQYSGKDTIDTTELQKEFGKYIEGQKLDFFKALNLELTVTKYMTTVVTDKLQWRASQSIISSVLQQFTPKWTPSGQTTFTPITIDNYPLKVNLPITPSDILESYIGYMYDENVTPDQMPIVKYITDVLLLPKLAEDLELALANGTFVEFKPTADGQAAPTNSDMQSMDGFLTQLKNLKKQAGNKVTWLLDGVVLTDANILEEVEKAVDSVPYKYKKKQMLIHADPDLITMYRRAYREKYPVTKNEDEYKFRVDFSNFTFAPVDGMIGTMSFFITPKENFIHLMSRNPNDAKMFIQVQNYDVKVFMEFRKGTGFAMQEALFAYLPPVTPPTDDSNEGGI